MFGQNIPTFPTPTDPNGSPRPKYTTPLAPTVITDSSAIEAITAYLLVVYNFITDIKLYISNLPYYYHRLLELSKTDLRQDSYTFHSIISHPVYKNNKYILFKIDATFATL